ncbi:MAG: hypothetical protein M3416_01050 [Acidobacteriota bacterium]|nr:hypothetical protein [Acidobacteriota bacterium]
MLPHLTNENPWFTFLVHFRNVEDMERFGGGSFLRHYSRDAADFQSKMCSLPPVVGGEVVFGAEIAWGEIVVIMRMPDAMIGPEAYKFVSDALALTVRRGASVVGLGALTSPATGGGLSLLRHLPPKVTLTNGNGYTAAVVRRNVVEASEILGLGWRARVAVVGCTGSVGVAASHLLAQSGFELTLVGRSARRAQHHLGDIAPRAKFAGELAALREADIIVLLTSDPSAGLMPHHVKPEAVVIDCAQPANIEGANLEEFRRRQITVVEGGIVRIPGYSSTLDLGVSDCTDTFACLAETYLFAREGIREHSVGRPTAEFALRMERIAARHGVSARPLGVPQSSCALVP